MHVVPSTQENAGSTRGRHFEAISDWPGMEIPCWTSTSSARLSSPKSIESRFGMLARTCQPAQQSRDRPTRHHSVAVLAIAPINQVPET